MLDHMMVVKRLAGAKHNIKRIKRFISMPSSYSIKMLKCSAFEHELVNILEIIPLDQQDEEILAVKNYLTKRVLELKN